MLMNNFVCDIFHQKVMKGPLQGNWPFAICSMDLVLGYQIQMQRRLSAGVNNLQLSGYRCDIEIYLLSQAKQ